MICTVTFKKSLYTLFHNIFDGRPRVNVPQCATKIAVAQGLLPATAANAIALNAQYGYCAYIGVCDVDTAACYCNGTYGHVPAAPTEAPLWAVPAQMGRPLILDCTPLLVRSPHLSHMITGALPTCTSVPLSLSVVSYMWASQLKL